MYVKTQVQDKLVATIELWGYYHTCTCNETEGLHDKISTKLYRKKYMLPLALLLMLRTSSNTDSNKLVVFSGIAILILVYYHP